MRIDITLKLLYNIYARSDYKVQWTISGYYQWSSKDIFHKPGASLASYMYEQWNERYIQISSHFIIHIKHMQEPYKINPKQNCLKDNWEYRLPKKTCFKNF